MPGAVVGTIGNKRTQIPALMELTFKWKEDTHHKQVKSVTGQQGMLLLFPFYR